MGWIVVTGGLGFIGSHVVDRLIEDNYNVTVLDDLSSGQLDNLDTHLSNSSFRFVKGDIGDRAKVEEALTGADTVIHLAAIVSVIRSILEPELIHQVNVMGTLNLLDECIKRKISRFVFASSAAVYGRCSNLPLNEEYLTDPLSPYAAAKVAGEAYCQAYYATYGLDTVILRFMNVYGPRTSAGLYSGVMIKFADAIANKKPLTIYGDGEQTRDFTYVSDVVEAIILALNQSEASGEIFNVGTGVQKTVNQLADLFIDLCDSKPQIRYRRARKGEVKHSYADVSKAKRILKYHPKIDLPTGVERFLKWYRSRTLQNPS